ncbi:efflux RND transporter periplasmic adaptor subunit [Xylella taiwanensis]|uniref:RND transporter n=1 Tax=Xylella taiwanensis TaxID=1444770 RepID=Z9JJ48_9GAMM|nr:efflux RND transporter periplasmic adaptor subunit [Xylella taiwanensis]EWS77988.1 RND transporter [Xylella taiwanensis]QKD98424.1 efflux RND transporter periplasmic adaptor subunit [Xylella taiwanensis]UFM93680.1 efflux RND transporter periplasmic adaptor subunit [Xylella taiwanensis]UFN02259.1 efflux RND transporter periplasmic adaptor subunit [Xylella taiwanensis]UFN15917.1 efflux RND transporter periplasmic adaptor subunit [Xylella taiwanensis]
MSTVLVLGAGIGDMNAADALHDELSSEHRVVVLSEIAIFSFTQWNQWGTVGWCAPTEVQRDASGSLVNQGIDLLSGGGGIEPGNGRVLLYYIAEILPALFCQFLSSGDECRTKCQLFWCRLRVRDDLRRQPAQVQAARLCGAVGVHRFWCDGWCGQAEQHAWLPTSDTCTSVTRPNTHPLGSVQPLCCSSARGSSRAVRLSEALPVIVRLCLFRPWYLLFLSLAFAACSSQSAPLTPPAPPVLSTVPARTMADRSLVSWDGVVEAVRHATLSSQTSGRVAGVYVDIGDHVAAGAVLLRLTAVEQQADSHIAQAELAAAQAQLAQAQAYWKRIEALAPSQYVSRAQVDVARTAYDAARANRDAAHARLIGTGQQAVYTVVRAPYSGVVVARNVEVDETVVAGQPLMAIYVPGGTQIDVQVPQTVADTLRAQPQARVILATGRTLEAARVIVHPRADATTHTVGVRVLLPLDAQAIVPGTTAKVVFPGGATQAATPWIPAAALFLRGELVGAYVVTPQRIVLRQLRLGERRGDQVEVLAGIGLGERVAVDPLQALQTLQVMRRVRGVGAGRDE